MKKNKFLIFGALFVMLFFMNGCFKTALLNKIGNKNSNRRGSRRSSSGGSTVRKGKVRHVGGESSSSSQRKSSQAVSGINIDRERNTVKSSGDILITFTDDYNKPNQDKKSFTSDDSIYAVIKIDKSVVKFLDLYNIHYYKSILGIVVDKKQYQYANYDKKKSKNQEGRDNFKTYYDSTSFIVPIVTKKDYYESILKSTKGAQKVVVQSFPANDVAVLSKVPAGNHLVEINLRYMAKTRSNAKYTGMMKGFFTLNISNSGKAKYRTLSSNYRQWDRYYEGNADKIRAEKEFNVEQEKIKKMSPAMRECYLAAKNSSFGYLACYKGPVKRITFYNRDANPSMGSPSTIYVIYKAYRGRKKDPRYSGGKEGVFCPSKGSSVTIPVPIGAKVIRGKKTFFRRVSRRSKSRVTLRWFHDK